MISENKLCNRTRERGVWGNPNHSIKGSGPGDSIERDEKYLTKKGVIRIAERFLATHGIPRDLMEGSGATWW